MNKPDSLRAHLLERVPALRHNPDRLLIFIDNGKVRCTAAASLSFEYSFDLQVILTDFAGHPDTVMLPLLAWVRVHQSELLANLNTSAEDIQFEADVLARLAPAERNTLARTVAQKLRRSQQQRMVAQRNPDGSAFKARKPRNLRGKQGRIQRNAKMFQKLRTARFLKAKGDSNAVALSFAGRVALIARVHQYGLKDRAQKGAPDSRYPRRRLPGFTPADVDLVGDELLKHLTARQV